jgi:hypothetical protein
MTQHQFLALCLEHCITPEIALDNDSIVEALKARDDVELARILLEEF